MTPAEQLRHVADLLDGVEHMHHVHALCAVVAARDVCARIATDLSQILKESVRENPGLGSA